MHLSDCEGVSLKVVFLKHVFECLLKISGINKSYAFKLKKLIHEKKCMIMLIFFVVVTKKAI